MLDVLKYAQRWSVQNVLILHSKESAVFPSNDHVILFYEHQDAAMFDHSTFSRILIIPFSRKSDLKKWIMEKWIEKMQIENKWVPIEFSS